MFTEAEKEYMTYLDEVTGVEGYGLLMAKGDPIAFEVGRQEEEAQREIIED